MNAKYALALILTLQGKAKYQCNLQTAVCGSDFQPKLNYYVIHLQQLNSIANASDFSDYLQSLL